MLKKLIAFVVTYLLVILYILWLTHFLSGVFQLAPRLAIVARILLICAATIGAIVGFAVSYVKRRKGA